MSRSLRIPNYELPGAILAVLAAFILALITQSAVFAQGSDPTDDEVNKVAKQLYCPVCESTPLDVCPTEACRQWRELIRDMLAQDKSEAEIKQYFVDHYGPQVLNEPPNRLASYLVPVLAFVLGSFILFRGFRMWLKPSTTEAGSAGAERPAKPAQDPYIAKFEEELKKQQ